MERKKREIGNVDNSENFDWREEQKRVIGKRAYEIIIQIFCPGIFYDSSFIYSNLL